MQNSDQIKETDPELADYVAHVEDPSEELDELCNLLNDIEQRPNGAQQLKEIRAILMPYAGEVAEGAPHYSIALGAVAEELAGAFATIVQYRDYIPADVYNPISEALLEWVVGRERWMSDPAMLECGLGAILSLIFIRKHEEKEEA